MQLPDPDHAALNAALAPSAALCTLVAVEGGFSRAPGAQLVVRADGSTAGDMTGGCLEAALVAEVRAARAAGGSRLVRYGKGSGYIDIRLPCGGGVEIYIDIQPNQEAIAAAIAQLAMREPAVLDIAGGKSAALKRYYHPQLRLLLFGAGPEMNTLGTLAQAWGAEVHCVSSHMKAALPPTEMTADAWTAIVLLFHEHEWEDDVLSWALLTPAFYIGALGSQTAVSRRCTALQQRGFDAPAIARVRGPIGLIRMAKDAQMLAISILAEVAHDYGVLTKRLPGG